MFSQKKNKTKKNQNTKINNNKKTKQKPITKNQTKNIYPKTQKTPPCLWTEEGYLLLKTDVHSGRNYMGIIMKGNVKLLLLLFKIR